MFRKVKDEGESEACKNAETIRRSYTYVAGQYCPIDRTLNRALYAPRKKVKDDLVVNASADSIGVSESKTATNESSDERFNSIVNADVAHDAANSLVDSDEHAEVAGVVQHLLQDELHPLYHIALSKK